MTRTLDPFEQALLTELRRHVAERDVVPVRTGRRRLAAVGAGILAAGSAATGAVLLQPDPAFAVHEDRNGDVVVTISSLKDADGLERALAEHGVDADVSYDAEPFPDAPPIPPSGDAGDAAASGTDSGPSLESHGAGAAPGGAPCGAIAVETDGDGVTFRLPASAIAAESPLRIQLAGEDLGWASIGIQWEQPVC
ncbi:hypothetical protein RB608_19060 [Nocardioides sp. LHD-245]|uniref:hypothetical protein n=1 Tax=Nocardioides sp. LHD-245 TaxID=3051387 RepID=UPI0027DFEAB5|nr:hypothetical protein [Nocardioides sp. LHD-245]